MLVGEILKEAREENGLSLDEIQEMTKIQKRYLEAIEQNNFQVLPGRFYARAFIKEYAQAVGLDHVELLKDFDENDIDLEEESVQYSRLEKSRRPKADKSSSIFSLLPTVIVIILVVGIIFVAWSLYQSTSVSDEDGGDTPVENDEIIRSVDEPESEEPIGTEEETEEEAQDEEEIETEESEETSEASFSVVETGSGNAPTHTLDFEYTEDTIVVELAAEGETYVEISGDSGTAYFVGELQPGETEQVEFSDEERVYFNVGNTTPLTITVNDVTLDYPVEDVIHQKMWINLLQQ